LLVVSGHVFEREMPAIAEDPKAFLANDPQPEFDP